MRKNVRVFIIRDVDRKKEKPQIDCHILRLQKFEIKIAQKNETIGVNTFSLTK